MKMHSFLETISIQKKKKKKDKWTKLREKKRVNGGTENFPRRYRFSRQLEKKIKNNR